MVSTSTPYVVQVLVLTCVIVYLLLYIYMMSTTISLYFFGVYIYTRVCIYTHESSQCDQKFSDTQIALKPSPIDRTYTN